MSSTIDNAFESMTGNFATFIRNRFDHYSKLMPRKLESPIEEAMLIGLLAIDCMIPVFHFEGDNRDPKPPFKAFVQPQVSIAGYRVDFLIDVTEGDKRLARIAIECDGHEFHDRTPDMAARDKARDRALTTAGLRVMRFTGREIHRDLSNCANDVLDAIIVMAGRKPPAP